LQNFFVSSSWLGKIGNGLVAGARLAETRMETESFGTVDLSPFHSAFKYIHCTMIDLETLGWRGWFPLTLIFLGYYSKKLAIGTALTLITLYPERIIVGAAETRPLMIVVR
jgi:hypothetical protein